VVLATGPPPVPPSGAHGLCLRDAWRGRARPSAA